MKEIIILGGGFAGVSAAIYLQKHQKQEEANISLIDENSYHLFTPSLYEVATSEEPKKNIAIPFSQIFDKNINFIQGKVLRIDSSNKLIHLLDKTSYAFDYLVIALGSEPSYFGIEGLEEHSIALKWLEQSVEIREKIKEAYHDKPSEKKEISVVVGGGGFSGTELTAELINYRKHLAKHHNLPKESFKISIIQGSDRLLKELDNKVSDLAKKRLEKENVNIILGAHIRRVDEKNIETDTGQKYSYDVLIWTGGVKASSIIEESGFKVNPRGQLAVNDNLQVLGFSNIFAVGDVAEFADPVTNKPVPGVAEVAEDQGKIVAQNVLNSLIQQSLISYKYLHLGYIVPLKGRFAVANLNKITIIGFLGWIIQQFVFLYYLLKILPIYKAIKKWNKFEMYLMHKV